MLCESARKKTFLRRSEDIQKKEELRTEQEVEGIKLNR